MPSDLKPRISFFFLLVVNLLPVLGVFLLDWNVFIVIFLYWLENIITGFYNILRMLTVQPWHLLNWLGKLFTVTFFTFHYGMFTAIHGIFVVMIFGGKSIANNGMISFSLIYNIIAEYKLMYVVLALYLSHGISFIINYIGGKEYQKVNLQILMRRPYGRIIILHIVVLIGGFFVMALRSPKLGIILLVFLKTCFDLAAHKKEHAKDKKQLRAR